MADNESNSDNWKVKREKELSMIKKYINYDKLVNNLIEEKEQLIRQKKIDIHRIQMNIMSLENDILRINEEREKSNCEYGHIFINPYHIYSTMTNQK